MCNAEILSALVLAETHSYDNHNITQQLCSWLNVLAKMNCLSHACTSACTDG